MAALSAPDCVAQGQEEVRESPPPGARGAETGKLPGVEGTGDAGLGPGQGQDAQEAAVATGVGVPAPGLTGRQRGPSVRTGLARRVMERWPGPAGLASGPPQGPGPPHSISEGSGEPDFPLSTPASASAPSRCSQQL